MTHGRQDVDGSGAKLRGIGGEKVRHEDDRVGPHLLHDLAERLQIAIGMGLVGFQEHFNGCFTEAAQGGDGGRDDLGGWVSRGRGERLKRSCVGDLSESGGRGSAK